MSLTDTLSHIGPKPRLSITVLNLSPYKEIYQRIQFLARTFVTHSGSIQVESIRPSLKPGTLSHCWGAVVSHTNTLTHIGPPCRPHPKLSITGLKPSSYILTSKPRSEPSNVQYRQVYDNIVNSSGKKPVLCELGATSLWVPVYTRHKARLENSKKSAKFISNSCQLRDAM
jgi:hypothetical protein